MKKKIASGLSAALLITSICGCNSSGMDSGNIQEKEFVPSLDTSTKTTIEVKGSWSNFEALEAVAADFNEIYPDVTISYTRVDDYTNMLSTIVTGADKPELVMFDVNGYYKNKSEIVTNLVDLSDIGLNTDVLDGNLNVCSSADGKFCALNWGNKTTGFVVNKKLLSELGVEIPTTHEEFLNACSALKSKGYTEIVGCNDSIYKNILNNDTKYRIHNLDNCDSVLNQLSNASDGCGKIFEKEFKQMFELVGNKYIDYNKKEEITDIYEASILYFFEGKTPFLCFDTEGFSGMKKRESKSETFTANPFEYEFVSLPVENDVPVLSVTHLAGLAAVSGSKEEELAKEFLRFTCSKTEIEKMAEVKGVPSSTKDSKTDSRFEQYNEIEAVRKVNPVSSEKLALADEAFAYTLEKIATGETKNVEEAETFFEQYLKSVNN